MSNLRKELEPIKLSEEKRNSLKHLIQQIETFIFENDEASTSEAISTFHKLTGHNLDKDFFRRYTSSMSIDEVVDIASNPPPKRVPDITKEELIEVVRRIQSEEHLEHMDYYISLLEANVDMPEVADLIFYPPDGFDSTPENVVNEALAYTVERLP